MSAHTKTLPTEERCTLKFIGPAEQANGAKKAMAALGFQEAEDTIPWRDAFQQWDEKQIPGVCLAGARHKEGLTQLQLSKMTGIPQRHISEMENGKRPIGKAVAKKFADALDVSYQLFL